MSPPESPPTSPALAPIADAAGSAPPHPAPAFRALTINIHKGFSFGNRRFILPRLREAIRASGADIVFLQEVLGRHDHHAKRIEGWPDQPQMEYLADTVWHSFAYGRNAIYQEGHHGNAILSKYIIEDAKNHDISSSKAERRGFLYGRMHTPCGPLHCVCLHLSLLHRDRVVQMRRIAEMIRGDIPADEPLLLAGDFNDWRLRAERCLARPAGLTEVFRARRGREARTFPSVFPLVSLDRIYIRGLRIVQAAVLKGTPWKALSDHAALYAEFGAGG